MTTLKVRAIGNSLGVVIPKEVLDRLRLGKDDELYLVDTSEGVELRPYDPSVAEQVERGRRIAKKYRSALHELAK